MASREVPSANSRSYRKGQANRKGIAADMIVAGHIHAVNKHANGLLVAGHDQRNMVPVPEREHTAYAAPS